MRSLTSPIVMVCCAVAWCAGAGPVRAGEVALMVGGAGFSVPVVSQRERPFQTVVRQRFDFSCGSAAVATLLTYHYDRPTSEEHAFRTMYEAGNQQLIRTQGFSLLDMRDYLVSRGLGAEGFHVTLDLFAREKIPGIALVNVRGYKHFVVLKGMRNGEVLVGDPALGVKVYPRPEFEAMWNGIVLVVIDETETRRARAHFNQASDWRLRPLAPFGSALRRDSLAGFSVMVPTFPAQIRPVIQVP